MNAKDLKAKFQEFADKTGDGKVDVKDAKALIDEAAKNFADDWFENVVIVVVVFIFGFAVGKIF